MNRFWLALALVATSIGAGAQGVGGTSQNPVLRVIPAGADGDSYVYNVQCRDKRFTSVEIRDDTNETCVHLPDQPKVCRVDWTLRDATRTACGG